MYFVSSFSVGRFIGAGSALLLVGSLGGRAQSVAPVAGVEKTTGAKTAVSPPDFPLKVSANGRYVVDRKNRPFLIAGDVPQSLMVNSSPAEADAYFANRRSYGFNAVWINLVNAAPYFPDCRPDGSTFDGIRPFTGYLAGGTDLAHYDLARTNDAYFARADRMLEIATKYGLAVFLDPIETGQWLATLRNNGPAACYAYGRFLGRRYKGYRNLIWFNGNDFDSWKNSPGDDAAVQAVARGIRSMAPEQLQTVELNGDPSLQDPGWRPLIALNGCYTYGVTYLQMQQCYRQNPPMPAFLMESHYEGEDVGNPPDFGTPAVVRRQGYWAMLSGGAGQLYGNVDTWRFRPGWQKRLDTPGAAQFAIWKRFFSVLPWHRLVPDSEQKIVVAGLGTRADSRSRVSQNDFCTAACTPDGVCFVAYLPTARTITVNMEAFRSKITGRWFDPVSGFTVAITDGPFANRGTRYFTPPKLTGKMEGPDSDWVLVLVSK